MGALKTTIFVCSVFMLYVGSTHAATTPTTPAGGGGGMGTTPMMEDWKIIAIVVPCVVGGLALLFCLICCCCCQGGAGGGGGYMCCDPNACGPMCDPSMCCGPQCCGPQCCGPMCDPNMCCGPHCCGPQCCGPMCDPAMCCGPHCCGPCCYVQPVTTAPVVTQYATRGQIWPQQACNYRCGPPGAVGSSQCTSSVPVNGGVYGRSLDTTYSGGAAQCGPCGQQPRGGGGYSYRY